MGRHPVTDFPAALGNEGAGVIEAVGPGVEGFKPGQRVAVAGGPDGSYAEARLAVAACAVALPEEIDDSTGAAMMVRGMTARYLTKRTYPVKRGDTILVHAASGGVGLILCQWAKALGATVIGTVGSDEKAALARANGCDHPIVYTREDFVKRAREITSGKGVAAVYDSVGKDTFEGSLNCLAPFGVLANFGEASGKPAPIAPGRLGPLGSIYLCAPSLVHHISTRERFLDLANDVVAAVRSGTIKINIGAAYPLAEAARAMTDLESRRTTGSVVLMM
jgi:NADPH2:quinone reductase